MTLAIPVALALLTLSLPIAVARAAEGDRQPLVIGGRIVDPRGQPVRNARCLWEWSQSPRELFVEVASSGDGCFEITEPQEVAQSPVHRASGTLWILAEGFAVHWQPYNLLPMTTTHRHRVDVTLERAQPYSYLVTDPEGHPRQGELVEPVSVLSARQMLSPPRPLKDLMSGTTDEAGQFRVNFLAADQGMVVRVMSERFGVIQQLPHTTRGGPPVVTLKFPRTGSIAGSIQTEQAELFSGMKVTLWSNSAESRLTRISGSAETTIDQHGRFSVPAIAEGTVSVLIDVPAQSEFRFGKQQEVHPVTAGNETVVRLTPIRLVPITGRVTGPGGALPGGQGTVTLSYDERNPEVTIPFDQNGLFSGRTYPGGIRLRADLESSNGTPVARSSVVGHGTLQVEANSKGVVTPAIELPKTRIVSGVVLGPNDRPLVGAVLYASFGKSSGAELRTDEAGQFRYVVSETTQVTSYMFRLSERTLMSFEQSNDPLVLRLRK